MNSPKRRHIKRTRLNDLENEALQKFAKSRGIRQAEALRRLVIEHLLPSKPPLGD
jgi:hypothetical protein